MLAGLFHDTRRSKILHKGSFHTTLTRHVRYFVSFERLQRGSGWELGKEKLNLLNEFNKHYIIENMLERL